MFEENLSCQIKYIQEEVKEFVTDKYAYYGVTISGFLFNIIKCKTLQPPIENPDDYYTYMWTQCEGGYFLLRQRFIEGVSLSWFLEVQVIPYTPSHTYFMEMADFLVENPKMLEKMCMPDDDE